MQTLEQVEAKYNYTFTDNDIKSFRCSDRNDFSSKWHTFFRHEAHLADFIKEEKEHMNLLTQREQYENILKLSPTFWISGSYISGLDNEHNRTPDNVVDLSGKGLNH